MREKCLQLTDVACGRRSVVFLPMAGFDGADRVRGRQWQLRHNRRDRPAQCPRNGKAGTRSTRHPGQWANNLLLRAAYRNHSCGRPHMNHGDPSCTLRRIVYI
ncbi:hypothetical protein Rmet_4184 (plasmid) [Cupriavidus metallidurans CH34]|uniref:Uncharacterized protein n=1 Tax=Cupriavidus metallidurans (strain ATCC 43123 / DSM 2839 / NBRC 102507 / CH34) TaxID=266264 RepID=Q1LFM5_CUPMC|nr:hypothetical protein Rmet_4184 [Cupriavidus metallidurans CH34]